MISYANIEDKISLGLRNICNIGVAFTQNQLRSYFRSQSMRQVIYILYVGCAWHRIGMYKRKLLMPKCGWINNVCYGIHSNWNVLRRNEIVFISLLICSRMFVRSTCLWAPKNILLQNIFPTVPKSRIMRVTYEWNLSNCWNSLFGIVNDDKTRFGVCLWRSLECPILWTGIVRVNIIIKEKVNVPNRSDILSNTESVMTSLYCNALAPNIYESFDLTT